MRPGHAEIVGGGFGGLVAATALAERGWSVRLHERRGKIDAEGYGIAVQPNMMLIFAALGIAEEVIAGGARIDRRDSLDGEGDVVLTRKTERSPYRIDRRHIVRLLARRAAEAGAEIRLGSPVTGVSPDGTVALGDESRTQAELIVVADGARSSLRAPLALLKHRIWQRDGGVRVTIPRTSSEIAEDAVSGTVMIEAWSDNRRVLYCPVNDTENYVLLGSLVDDGPGKATPIDPEVWSRSFPGLKAFLARVAAHADWDEARWEQFQTVRLKRWWKGRVAVLGDAAHAMPPYLAQGAGHAMMNALGLAVALDEEPDLSSAFRMWERRERPITEHTQRWTRIYGNTIFLPRPLKRVSIAAERRIPWIGRQYLHAAHVVPTGCAHVAGDGRGIGG